MGIKEVNKYEMKCLENCLTHRNTRKLSIHIQNIYVCTHTHTHTHTHTGFPLWLSAKESARKAGASGDVSSEDPLEEGMATHSRILAWKIPWTVEPGRLWSIGLKKSDTTEGT